MIFASSGSGERPVYKRFLLIAALMLVAAVPAEAQQSKKIPRIGYPTGGSNLRGGRTDAFRQGLHDLGYFEGKNIVIEWRYAKGNPNLGPSMPLS